MSGITLESEYDLGQLSSSVTSRFNLWEASAPASKPISELDEFARTISFAGIDEISQEASSAIAEIKEALKAKKIKSRLVPYKGDVLSSTIMAENKLLELIKPFKKSGQFEPRDVMVETPIYDAHAITAWGYNSYSADYNIKGPSKIKGAIAKLEDDDTLPPHVKAMQIASLRAKRETEEIGSAKFDTLPPHVRGLKATIGHLLLGADCATPTKALVIYTPDGLKETKEMVSEKAHEKSRWLGLQVYMASKLKIPVYNIANSDDVTKLLDKINSI